MNDGYRVIISTHKLTYRCEGCGAVFDPKHVKAGCPPIEGEVLAYHQRTGRMANWEAWIQDPRDCQPYHVVMLPSGSGSRLYTWYEAVTGRAIPDGWQLLLTINSNEVGSQGVCLDEWHVPTVQEWHRLGVNMGSGTVIPIDGWQPHALHGLASFSYYSVTGLREGNDESGFSWLPTPFAAIRGVDNGSVRHGALWSAGETDDTAADSSTTWTVDPLPCPVGWRLPTREEYQALVVAGGSPAANGST